MKAQEKAFADTLEKYHGAEFRATGAKRSAFVTFWKD
jgi:hypothetical protein